MRVYVNLLQKKSNTSFYAKIDKDLTFLNQNIVKNTINDLIAKQELPDNAKNLTITTPRTLCTYFLTKFHKPSNPGRPIVFYLLLSLSNPNPNPKHFSSKCYHLTLMTANTHLKFFVT